MSFKRGAGFFTVALTLGLLGCGVRFNQPALKPPPVKISSSEMQCLSHATEDIQAYFEARSTAAEIEGFWDCASRALDFFGKFVSGSGPGGSYAPTDLRAFLELYYLGQLKISDRMLVQAMRFKQVLFGRSESRLEFSDLSDIRKFIGVLKEVSLNLRPYIAIYTMRISQGISQNELEAAALALENASARITPIMATTKTNYQLSDLLELLRELQLILIKRRIGRGHRL